MGVDQKKILIVEDDTDLRFVISDLVEEIGYSAVSCSNPKIALTQLKEGNHFDLIVSDITMPQMDGIEFVKSIRHQKFLTPIVIISAFVTRDRMVEIQKLGCFEIVDKPFNRKALQVTIQNALKSGTSLVKNLLDEGGLMHKSINIGLKSVHVRRIEELAERKNLSVQTLLELWILQGLNEENAEKTQKT